MKSLILFGSGGHCKSCIDVIESSDEYKIKGIVIHLKKKLKNLCNIKLLVMIIILITFLLKMI